MVDKGSPSEPIINVYPKQFLCRCLFNFAIVNTDI